MSISNGCKTLKSHKVGQNNSGVRIDPDSSCEIDIREKWLVDLCLNCERSECSYKIRDDVKQERLL